MKHNELLDKIYWYWRRDNRGSDGLQPMVDYRSALLAVVELHIPDFGTPNEKTVCDYCKVIYPCPTIQAIEKALTGTTHLVEQTSSFSSTTITNE